MRKKVGKSIMRAGPLLLMLLAFTGRNAHAFIGFGDDVGFGKRFFYCFSGEYGQ